MDFTITTEDIFDTKCFLFKALVNKYNTGWIHGKGEPGNSKKMPFFLAKVIEHLFKYRLVLIVLKIPKENAYCRAPIR